MRTTTALIISIVAVLIYIKFRTIWNPDMIYVYGIVVGTLFTFIMIFDNKEEN